MGTHCQIVIIDLEEQLFACDLEGTKIVLVVGGARQRREVVGKDGKIDCADDTSSDKGKNLTATTSRGVS